MKKILTLLLLGMMIASLCGCGPQANVGDTTSPIDTEGPYISPSVTRYELTQVHIKDTEPPIETAGSYIQLNEDRTGTIVLVENAVSEGLATINGTIECTSVVAVIKSNDGFIMMQCSFGENTLTLTASGMVLQFTKK